MRKQQTLLEAVKDDFTNGMSQAGRNSQSPSYLQSLTETVRLIRNEDGVSQNRWKARIEEVMGTADFPLLFADTIDRAMLAKFQAIPPRLDPIFRQAQLRDFRDVKRFRHEGLTSRLQIVPQQAEYEERDQAEEEFSYALVKYGAATAFSWEMFLNDDLGAFDRFPDELADSARNTEAWKQTETLWDLNGPIDAVFVDAVNGQAAVSDLALTVANLGTAIEAMQSYTSNGEPILNTPVYLVVPSALEITAREILTSTSVAWTESAGGAATAHPTVSAISNYRLQLIVDPWLPIVVTAGTLGATTWALFANPAQAAIAEFARRAGSTGPELWMATPNAVRVGGGALGPFEGSFENDTIRYRVRHCMNAVALEARGGWASDGQ